MKSILQLDRETQLDRQRRFLFCWCYQLACEKNTAKYSNWDMYISRTLDYTVECFVSRCTSRCAAIRKVPIQMYLAVLLWAVHAGEFPEELKIVPPTHFIQEDDFLSCCVQQNAIICAQQEVMRLFRFRANNVDHDFTTEEQEAARQELQRLISQPFGL